MEPQSWLNVKIIISNSFNGKHKHGKTLLTWMKILYHPLDSSNPLYRKHYLHGILVIINMESTICMTLSYLETIFMVSNILTCIYGTICKGNAHCGEPLGSLSCGENNLYGMNGKLEGQNTLSGKNILWREVGKMLWKLLVEKNIL